MSSSRLKPTWSAAFELAGQRWRLALTSTAAASLSTNDRPLLPMLNRAAGSQVRSPGLIFSANSAALLQAARTPSQGSSQNFCRSFSGRPAAAGLAQLGISSRLKSTVCAAGRRDTSRQQQSFRLQSISVVCETNRNAQRIAGSQGASTSGRALQLQPSAQHTPPRALAGPNNNSESDSGRSRQASSTAAAVTRPAGPPELTQFLQVFNRPLQPASPATPASTQRLQTAENDRRKQVPETEQISVLDPATPNGEPAEAADGVDAAPAAAPEAAPQAAQPQSTAGPPSASQTAPSQPLHASEEHAAVLASGVEGTVQKVLFRRPDTGYAILQVNASSVEGRPDSSAQGARTTGGSSNYRHRPFSSGHSHMVSVKGVLPAYVSKGCRMRFQGHWRHSKWGTELDVTSCEELEMSSQDDLVSYLAGASLPGIGQMKARAIVEGLGADHALDILGGSAAVSALVKCQGIGKATAVRIKEAWDSNKGRRAAEDFLKTLGVTSAVSHRLLEKFGTSAEQHICRDPYTTLRIAGGDFSLAEAVAAKLDLKGAHDSDSRGELALVTALAACTRPQGHTHALWSDLRAAARELLCTAHGSPWQEEERLIAVAEGLRAKGAMVAEPPVQQAPDDLPPVSDAATPPRNQSSAAHASDGLQEDVPPAGSSFTAPLEGAVPQATPTQRVEALAKYLIERTPYVGERNVWDIIKRHGAENIVKIMEGADAVKALRQVPGIQKKAPNMKDGWDKNRGKLGSPPEVSAADAAKWLKRSSKATALAPTDLPSPEASLQPLDWAPDARCYSPLMHEAETGVAQELARLAAQQKNWGKDFDQRVLSWLDKTERKQDRKLSAGQRQAVLQASQAPLLVLTGGPGCGKTTATATLLRFWRATGRHIAVCAPTGRAAQKLQETCGDQDLRYAAGEGAVTIHRLLKCTGGKDQDRSAAQPGVDDEEEEDDLSTRFVHNESNPLEVDAVLVDETSMLDIALGLALLRALPKDRFCQLVLVGDADQLAPVGPGTILEAAMKAGVVPIIDLREVFRQAAESAIVTSAHALLRGEMPALTRDPHYPQVVQAQAGTGPAQVGEAELPQRAAGWLSQQAVWLPLPAGVSRGPSNQLVSCLRDALRTLQHGRIRGGPIQLTEHVQVIAPMRRGASGVTYLNKQLQAMVNPPAPHGARPKPELAIPPQSAGKLLRVGDRVMQVVNDYDEGFEVYNGDVGFVKRIDEREKSITVEFPPVVRSKTAHPRQITYTGQKLRELELAWATTVHKSQGGESPVVILLLTLEHNKLLTRRLLYTALTRAQHLVVVAGQEQAIRRAVANVQTDTRLTQLPARLRAAALAQGLSPVSPQRFPPLPATPLLDAPPAAVLTAAPSGALPADLQPEPVLQPEGVPPAPDLQRGHVPGADGGEPTATNGGGQNADTLAAPAEQPEGPVVERQLHGLHEAHGHAAVNGAAAVNQEGSSAPAPPGNGATYGRGSGSGPAINWHIQATRNGKRPITVRQVSIR